MSKYSDLVLEAINEVAIQIEGLQQAQISVSLPIIGQGSVFDSFALLILFVELETKLNLNSSLVEWFTNLNFEEDKNLTVEELSELIKEAFGNESSI